MTEAFVLLDGRPAQGRPRGMGIYVTRLVQAFSAQPDGVKLKVALDKNAGADPWADLPQTVERVWGEAKHTVHWEQTVLPAMAGNNGAALIHYTANASAWKCAIPHVVTVHDVIFMRSLFSISDRWYWRQAAAHLYYRYGVRRGARRAQMILTDSEYSRTQVIKKLKLQPGKVRVIPLAEPNVTEPLPEDELNRILAEMDIKRPYVLGLGAIDKRKNTANLIRAFARLPRSAAPMLVLAGFEKQEQSNIPRMITEYNLTPRVRLVNYVPAGQLAALFQGAAVFVYPSFEEGFGLPILQAFLQGIPVVTTQTASIIEVAGQAVRFADPADPRSLSREIMTVLTDPSEAHRLAYAGYMQAKRFNWANTARQTLEAYRRVLNIKK
jgi:glycosyltransferase involved in cell wall biosynthesis